MDSVKRLLNEHIAIIFADYGLVITCLFIGFTVGWLFKTFIVDRKSDKLINDRIRDKDLQINDLKQIVYEKLNVEIHQIDPGLFKRLKKFFKKICKGSQNKKLIIMNALLTILSLIGFLIFFVYAYLDISRKRAIFQMQRLVDNFEFYLINQRGINKDEIFQLLTTMKRISANPESLDIQILIMSKKVAEVEGNLSRDLILVDKAINGLNDDLLKIYNDFNTEADRIIGMSLLKPDFIFFILPLLFSAFFKYGTETVAKAIKEYKFLLSNDEAVIYSGLRSVC